MGAGCVGRQRVEGGMNGMGDGMDCAIRLSGHFCPINARDYWPPSAGQKPFSCLPAT